LRRGRVPDNRAKQMSDDRQQSTDRAARAMAIIAIVALVAALVLRGCGIEF